MIKIENVEVVGWEHAIRGMRNPLNSWPMSDSDCAGCFKQFTSRDCESCTVYVGSNDLDLMKRLVNAGTDHRKFMRMIVVYCDITAPLYWWKEFDTYKVGTVRNSCSTMHKIHSKEFAIDDFSVEHLGDEELSVFNKIIDVLDANRMIFNSEHDKWNWYRMIQLLPSSYNQRSTVMLNYEVMTNMYHSRKNHKLDEWKTFCKWIETLPYSELITGEASNEVTDSKE